VSRPRADTAARLALAHALRTPVTSLALGVGLLREERVGPLTPAQRDVVRTLEDELARLQLLVDRALETDRLGSHAGPVERVPTELASLVRRALAPLGAQAREKGVRLCVAAAEDVWAVVDRVKLPWVLASLAGNALRYSPRGGAVEVVLAAAGEVAEVRVRDEGPGLPPEVSARLFDRDGGRGWTLFLVREIVEAHGGEIAVEAGPVRGSCFTLRLPLAAPAARAALRRKPR
jgi:signal transduction histidine kinase